MKCQNNLAHHCVREDKFCKIWEDGKCMHFVEKDYPSETVFNALDNDHPQSRKKIHTKEVKEDDK